MKKEVKNKENKMTIDKLAIMMNNGFERFEQKMATKEDLENLEKKMATKEDLEILEKKMATKEDLKTQQEVTQIMLKEINAIHADTKSFRENISTLYTDHLAYDRKIDNLAVRVEKLEIKN